MSQLLPDGITHLGDCPYPLHEAILTALRVLAYEEFPSEERPPRRIWLDGPKLKEWWADVERKREEKFKVGSDPSVDGEYEENAAAEGLIARG